MKNILTIILSATILFGVVPANTVTQKVTDQCCQIVLTDASEDIKKKKKKKGLKKEKGKKKRGKFFSKLFGSK